MSEQAVMDWKVRRRPPLDEEELASTVRHLNMLGWIDTAFSEELKGDELLEAA